MPHRPSLDGSDDEPPPAKSPSQSPSARNMWGRTWSKVENWLKKDSEEKHGKTIAPEKSLDELGSTGGENLTKRGPIASLPRPLTFERQNSEMRDRLCPHEPDAVERRASSVDRRGASRGRGLSSSSSIHPSQSAPDVYSYHHDEDEKPEKFPEYQEPALDTLYPGRLEQFATNSTASLSEEQERLQIQAELESKWILNLSMYFKDRSDREKFFLTYAEQPNKWRRVTVSCDYRNAAPDSLEWDLKHIHYQRDKSARIYEAIRASLPSIQFYPTVTNLKLKTIDGRLHIHCSEDVNEIIKYPHAALLEPISCPRYKESDVVFQSHMSGFVYRVSVHGKIYVKKEIPGPEAVDEFLYEANALSALHGSKNVISFQGLVLNDDETQVKGLLISLAAKGALVDLIYDSKYDTRYTNGLPWTLRERWARQIVNGLMEIHEAGFVQGDFTLSNLVVDGDDNVFLIDINRRGCPVGWEPPELEPMIKAGQRISMFIGVKTDLFQLGMVLWGLAMHIDEPEREPRPLGQMTEPDIPDYYRQIVKTCLSQDPRGRLSAKELLMQFPPEIELSPHEQVSKDIQTTILERQEKKYIDPDSAIGIDDLPTLGKNASLHAPSQVSEASSYMTFGDGATSSEYMFDGGDSVTHNVEIFPVQSTDEDLVKQVKQIDLTDPHTIVQVEASDYFISPSETHLQSPASELSSSTPTLLGPSFIPLPQSPPAEPEITKVEEPKQPDVNLSPAANIIVLDELVESKSSPDEIVSKEHETYSTPASSQVQA